MGGSGGTAVRLSARKHARLARRAVTEVDTYLGSRIAQRRLLLGLSQHQLAKTLGFTFQQLQKYENGVNRVSASRLYQLAQVLRVPIAWFYEGLHIGRKSSSTPADLSQLTDPEVLQLVRAYYCIKDAAARFRFRGMVSALVGEK